MFLLPKGSPLFENLAATKLKLPEVLSKLSSASFTGYASFIFSSNTVILVFEAGKLVTALDEDVIGNRKNGFDALNSLIELMFSSTSGALNVYKLSKDLTLSIHALLQGEVLYKAQDLKLIDIKTLLEKIKNDQMNGCLRIYTDERSAMIFYKGGAPLGFFHDGAQDIEATSSESQKIAALPGAKIDLFSTVSVEELMDMDLLEVANIQMMWESANQKYQAEREKLSAEKIERDKKAVSMKLYDYEQQIKSIVTEYVGKVGNGLVDKELAERGGNSAIVDEVASTQFLAAVERGAKLLISATNIKNMMEKLTTVITAAKSEI